ncbi:MAG: hypothetical protein H7263_08240 [Candidatus Sericytochromatia bacterium]|nr:hypothetical protein [Candidatus Sericytochromatia bacterium]
MVVILQSLKLTGDTLQGDARTLKTNYLNPFPVPQNVTPQFQEQIKNIVLQVLMDKKQNINTSELENELNNMVYQLYDLTQDEINFVEGL